MALTDREYLMYKEIVKFMDDVRRIRDYDWDKFTMLEWGMYDACQHMKEYLLEITDSKDIERET